MIESQDFLNSTDVFVSTLRGFETVDQSLQVKIGANHNIVADPGSGAFLDPGSGMGG
jgi:hypothetical protein